MKAIRNYAFTVSFLEVDSKPFVSITAKHKMIPTATYDLIKAVKIKKQISSERFSSTVQEQLVELIAKMNERGAL